MNAILNEKLDTVWKVLETIPDPEIPVITVVELGVIRAVDFKDDFLQITITPTYSGCPAMKQFEDDIVSELNKAGFADVRIKTVFDPAWTTDWMSDEAREKLRVYGIAPPEKGSNDKGVLFAQGPKVVACPQCRSEDTKLVSQFGSTACKALYSCNSCKETFDYFKCI